MSNKNMNSRIHNGTAANCKKVLKNGKIKWVSAAAAVFTVALTAAAGIAVSAKEPPLTAELSSSINTLSAEKIMLPPKEYDVKIIADGKNHSVKCAGTVQDALDAADIDVYDDDLINIGLSEPLNPNTEIIINRVDIVEEVQVKVLNYATKYKEDDEQLIGYEETIIDGEKGEVETTLRNVYIDGELISSAVIDTDITEPVDQIIVVGTKEEPEPEPEPVYIAPETAEASQTEVTEDVPLDENGIPLEYSNVLTGRSCAYTAAPGSLTASGRKAQVGVVAVDPDIIPYGTELYIAASDGSEVYGYAVAGDTGGALVDGRILVDLFMNTTDECYQWGSREVNIYILD